jgi:hypothetical protein
MIPYGMKQDDARKLDHATLEAMRIRAVRRRGGIAPAEEKAKALEERRCMFEAELTKPQLGGSDP